MGKIRVEICLISARGLRRSSSLWKLQWFAVGWIDPEHKYCTKIDGSGSSNPTWRTKFSASFDDSNPNLHALALDVEVYRREPIFLREKLHGDATILLKEFFVKFLKRSEVPESAIEEVGSFQLRRKGSNKPQGFVDVSVQISEEREGVPSFSGNEEGGFNLSDQKSGISLDIADGSMSSYPSQPFPGSVNPPMSYPYAHPMPATPNYYNPPAPPNSYRPPRTPPPPPPPPPSHVGLIPTFLPGTNQLPENYINLPSSSAGGRAGTGPGFAAGVGAGALSAGAVIFGDDFMAGFNLPTDLHGGSLTVTTDPPF